MDGLGSRLLCVVVPCFDEEQALEPLYAELTRVLAELPRWQYLLYFVDDGSEDATLATLNALAARDERVRVLSLSRNFGHQIAITAGLDHVERRADAALVMDADLENPPALIPAMLDELESGHDVVMGVRATGRVVGWWKRIASRGFYWLFNRLSDQPIQPGAPDFFLLSRSAREALARMPEQHRFLRGMVAWIGFSRAYVAYVPPARVGGRSKYTLRRMLHLAADAFFAFSSAPVRLLARAGGLLALLGAGLLAYAIGRSWFVEAPASGALISGLVLFVGGLQLLGIGLVGGYVARVFEQSQGRPLYVLKQAPDERSREPRVLEVSPRNPRRASRH